MYALLQGISKFEILAPMRVRVTNDFHEIFSFVLNLKKKNFYLKKFNVWPITVEIWTTPSLLSEHTSREVKKILATFESEYHRWRKHQNPGESFQVKPFSKLIWVNLNVRKVWIFFKTERNAAVSSITDYCRQNSKPSKNNTTLFGARGSPHWLNEAEVNFSKVLIFRSFSRLLQRIQVPRLSN